MPLMLGNSKHIVGENIRELRNSGRPEAQAIAIAMRKAGLGAKKRKRTPSPLAPLKAEDIGKTMRPHLTPPLDDEE